MARKPKPSHVVELPLAPDPADRRRLLGLFTAGARLNNVLLQEGLAKVDALRADPAWAEARLLPRDQRQARQDAFRAVRRAHGFSEYEFQARAVHHKNAAGFSDRLGSHLAQKLGSKVFAALEQYLFGKRGRPRFKGERRPLHSLEGKNNAAALRWDREALFLVVSSDWGIPVKDLKLAKDEWRWSALQGEVKYCRVLWRAVGTERRYYVQLVMDGPPPKKASVLTRLAPSGTQAGMDIGPSNLAWVTPTDAGLMRFCAEVEQPQKRIRQAQRQLDRQRRANNPDNYDAQGRAKRGRSWVASARQRVTEARLRALQARTARQRANAHGRDINLLLERARHFRHDGVSVKSLQRNYGRSIGARAPGHFMSELQRKAESAGGNSSSVNVRHLKTSQYDHSTGLYTKKSLSERWHVFGDGRGACQRDVYSAFLALHATQTADEDGVLTWAHDRALLERAWQALEPALRAKGLFRAAEQGTDSGSAETGTSIVLCAPLVKPSSVKARGSAPGRAEAARGDARVRTVPAWSV